MQKRNDFSKRNKGSSSPKPQRRSFDRQSNSPADKNRQPSPSPRRERDYPKEWRVVVGTHAILEALKVNSKQAQMLWLKQGWESSQELKKLYADFKNIIPKVETKPASFLDNLTTSHQGAALFLNSAPQANWEEILLKEQAKVLILDGIEDVQNLGAILRTSWLMEVDVVLIPQDRAVGLTPAVHKVACGGVEHVPVILCSNFSKYMEDLKNNDFWIFGLSHLGKGTVFDLKIPQKIVWCVGAEDKGLRVSTERLCDELVRIPQASAAASYNASVATAMALLETTRQQAAKKS